MAPSNPLTNKSDIRWLGLVSGENTFLCLGPSQLAPSQNGLQY
jgi:hypothetical protein